MILSSHEIVKRLETETPGERLVIDPYSEKSQQPASYDLRAGEDVMLRHGHTTLVASMEWVELPCDLAATLRCRSSYGRRGILLGAGFVDPGFHGQLTMCLVNMGSDDVSLLNGERVVQMILHEVKGSKDLYAGRYQDSIGVVEAR